VIQTDWTDEVLAPLKSLYLSAALACQGDLKAAEKEFGEIDGQSLCAVGSYDGGYFESVHACEVVRGAVKAWVSDLLDAYHADPTFRPVIPPLLENS
jgi:hypothetical protein